MNYTVGVFVLVFSYLADVAWLVLDPAALVKTLSPQPLPERSLG